MIKAINYTLKGFGRYLEFGPKNAIIGPNGSGKTTILQAIEYGCIQSIDGRKASLSDIYGGGDKPRVDVTYDGQEIGPQSLTFRPDWIGLPPRDLWARCLSSCALGRDEIIRYTTDAGLSERLEMLVPEWQRSILGDGMRGVDSLIKAATDCAAVCDSELRSCRAILAKPMDAEPVENPDIRIQATLHKLADARAKQAVLVDTMPIQNRLSGWKFEVTKLEKVIDPKVSEEWIKRTIARLEKKIAKIEVTTIPESAIRTFIRQSEDTGKCACCGRAVKPGVVDKRLSKLLDASAELALVQASIDDANEAMANLAKLKEARKAMAAAQSELFAAMKKNKPDPLDDTIAKLESELSQLRQQEREFFVYEGQKKQHRKAFDGLKSAESKASDAAEVVKELKVMKKRIASDSAKRFLAPANEMLAPFGIEASINISGAIIVDLHGEHSMTRIDARALGQAHAIILGIAFTVASINAQGRKATMILDEAGRLDDSTLASLLTAVDALCEKGNIEQVFIADPVVLRDEQYKAANYKIIHTSN